MEGNGFKVSFSLSSKLVLSIVILLMLVTVFLNSTTILLFTGDKRAYIYQSQSTQLNLAAIDFVSRGTRALDLLKNSLARVYSDPELFKKPAGSEELKVALDHQDEVIYQSIISLKNHAFETTVLSEATKAVSKELDLSGFKVADFFPSKKIFELILPELKEYGFTFLNVAKPWTLPILILMVVNPKASDHQDLKICLGMISLKSLMKDLGGFDLTITTSTGRVLFDTNPEVYYAGKNIAESPLFKASLGNQFSSGTQEFEEDSVHYLGSYLLPGLNVVALTKSKWQQVISATYDLIGKFILLGLMALGSATIFAILFAHSLTSPLETLYKATQAVASGQFNIDLKIQNRDEIGALAKAFNVMSSKILQLVEEGKEKVRLESEIAIASAVQQTLIPPPTLKSKYFNIESHYSSADKCGGDWWGYFEAGQKAVVMIADATGHGFPSALLTASAQSCSSVLSKLAIVAPNLLDSPANLLAFMNYSIFEASRGKIMMTFFAGIFDFETHQFTYTTAGHNPPWVFSSKNGRVKLTSLVCPGERLGEFPDPPPFDVKKIPFQTDDLFVFYTDGLVEGTNLEGVQFGKKRVRSIIESKFGLKDPKIILDEVMKNFYDHNQGKSLDDDLTLAFFQFQDLSSSEEARDEKSQNPS